MKRYKVIYYDAQYKMQPRYLLEISKLNGYGGLQIIFWSDGRKFWQGNFKNSGRNGLYKTWNPHLDVSGRNSMLFSHIFNSQRI